MTTQNILNQFKGTDAANDNINSPVEELRSHNSTLMELCKDVASYTDDILSGQREAINSSLDMADDLQGMKNEVALMELFFQRSVSETVLPGENPIALSIAANDDNYAMAA